jgi:hypothetical protein
MERLLWQVWQQHPRKRMVRNSRSDQRHARIIRHCCCHCCGIRIVPSALLRRLLLLQAAP